MKGKYYKQVKGGYIVCVSTARIGIEVTKAEYDSILTTIANKPDVPEGYGCCLRDADLTWELYKLPPEPEPDEPTVEDKAEAYDILMGVEQ